MPAVMKASTHQLALGAQVPTGGHVFSWGWDALEQLGHDSEHAVGRVTGLCHKTTVAVACGRNHSVALTADSQVFTWGCVLDGRLGHGGAASAPELVKGLPGVGGVDRVASVACGDRHSAAVTAAGRVYVWGSGPGLGLGEDCDSARSPVLLQALSSCKIQQVCCGATHSIAVAESGSVLSWGASEHGALGHGEMSMLVPCPTVIPRLEAVTSVSSGGDHNLAIDSAGAAFAWGLGEDGQLGHRRRGSCSYPLQVSTLQRVCCLSSSCGQWHSLVVSTAGHVYAFGSGIGGRLGNGSEDVQSTPVKLALERVVQVAAGAKHSVALTDDNQLYAWGSGPDNELGLVPGAPQSYSQFSSGVPTLLYSADALLHNRIFQVEAGTHHTLVLADKDCQLHLNITLSQRRDRLRLHHELTEYGANRMAKNVAGLETKLAHDEEAWAAESEALAASIKEHQEERWWLHENNGALFGKWQRANQHARALDTKLAGCYLGNAAITNSIIRFTRRDLLVHGFCAFATLVRPRVALRAERFLRLLSQKALFQNLMEAHLAYSCEHWRQVVWIALRDERLFVAITTLQQLLLRPAFAAWESSIRYPWPVDPRMAYIARRWARLPLAVGFREWKLLVAEAKRERLVMARAARKWQQQQLSKALNSLLEWHSERLRQQRLLNRALNRLIHRELARALAQWVHTHSRAMATRRFLRGVIRRMMRIQLSRAWESWQAWYEARCAQQQLLSKSLRRWRNRELAKGWLAWAEWYQEQCRIRDNLCRSLLRWKHRELAKGWLSWVAYCQEQARLRAVLGKATRRWRQQALCQGLNSWLAWYAELGRQRSLLNTALRRWARRELSCGFQRWLEHLEELRHSQRILARACGSFKHRELRKGWNSWMALLAHLAEQRARVRRALFRWIHSALSRALNTWAGWYLERLRQRRKLAAALQRWAKNQLSQALNSWVAWYERVLFQQRTVRGVVHRLQHRQLSRAWETLQDFPHWLKRVKAFLRSCVAKWTHVLVAKGMRSWVHWAIESRLRRLQLEHKKRLLQSTQMHSGHKNEQLGIFNGLEAELEAERQLLAAAERKLKVEQRNLEEEQALKAELSARLLLEPKPAGQEGRSWEELYLEAQERRVMQMARLRGLFLLSVMKHLQGDMWGRAFRAWAHGSLDPRELLLLNLQDLQHRERKLLGVLLRPVYPGF